MEQEGNFQPIKKQKRVAPAPLEPEVLLKQSIGQQIYPEMSDILRISVGGEEPLYILCQSFDQFEEDLAQMDLSRKTLIDKDRYHEIAQSTIKQVLGRIGNHVNPEVLHELFPHLDLKKLDDFDIRNSRIYWRVLSDKDYKKLRWEYGSGVNLGERIFLTHATAGATVGADSRRVYPPKKEYQIPGKFRIQNPSGRVVVILGEEKLNNKLKNTVQLERYMRLILRHEFLHALGIGKGSSTLFHPELLECLINYYALDSGKPEDWSLPISTMDGILFIKDLIEVIKRIGFTTDDVDKAIIGEKSESIESIKSGFTIDFGERSSKKIFDFDFDTFNSARKFLSGLMHRQGK